MISMAHSSRSKRGMLYATFYAKFQDALGDDDVVPTIMVPSPNPDPFNLDRIGDGYDVWTRGETQLLVLAVVLVILSLLFAAIVALDCGRNTPVVLRSGTLRDVVRHGTARIRSRGGREARRERRSGGGGNDDLKAPPLSYLAPPPYVDRRPDNSALPV